MYQATFITFAMLLVSVTLPDTSSATMETSSNSRTSTTGDWIRVGNQLVDRCRQQSLNNHVESSMFTCLSASTLRAMDRLTAINVINLPFDLKFVKDSCTNCSKEETAFTSRKIGNLNWHQLGNEFVRRLSRLLRSHSLHIPLPRDLNISEMIQGRRRHHHRRPHGGHGDFMGLMLFGSMAMAVIAIPLGFQFLAVLGGKALMLAKLALILTSIQGLKKIATSNMSYGLYHSPIHESRPWNFDRRWPDHHGGHFDGFEGLSDVHTPNLDGFRSRVIMPRVAFAGNARPINLQHGQNE